MLSDSEVIINEDISLDIKKYSDGMPLITNVPSNIENILLRPRTLDTFVSVMFLVQAIKLRSSYIGPLLIPYFPGSRMDRLNINTKGEFHYYEHMLALYPTGIVSVVSDTFDLWRVLTDYLPRLKTKILARDGKLVIRPDSGNPVDIICGDAEKTPGSPAFKGVIELLWDIFGGTTNTLGYKSLDSHIGAIYGDSITRDRATQIMQRLEAKGFASNNIVLGIGSFTYQYVTRDTFQFAMKATQVTKDSKRIDIFKNPVTDSGMKKSAKGRLAVLKQDNVLTLINQDTPEQEVNSLLKPVWRDGEFLNKLINFAEVRANARNT